VLDSNRQAITGVALECGIYPVLAEICGVLICGDSEISGEGSAPAFEERCGPVQVNYYPIPPELEHGNWSAQIWDALIKAPGILRTIHEIFRFTHHQDRGELGSLLASVDGNIDVLRALPNHLTVFLPTIDREGNDSETVEENIVPAVAPAPRQIKIRFGVDFSLHQWSTELEPKEWDRFIANYPWIALNLFTDSPLRQNSPSKGPIYLETPEGAGRLARACREQPYLLRAFPEAWGKLLGCSQESAGETRSAICIASEGPVVSKGYAIGLHPFELRLPDEAGLLPHVLNGFLEQSIFWYPHFKRNAAPAHSSRGHERTATMPFTASRRSAEDWQAILITCAPVALSDLARMGVECAPLVVRWGKIWQQKRWWRWRIEAVTADSHKDSEIKI